jgi:hypothetical protein
MYGTRVVTLLERTPVVPVRPDHCLPGPARRQLAEHEEISLGLLRGQSLTAIVLRTVIHGPAVAPIFGGRTPDVAHSCRSAAGNYRATTSVHSPDRSARVKVTDPNQQVVEVRIGERTVHQKSQVVALSGFAQYCDRHGGS